MIVNKKSSILGRLPLDRRLSIYMTTGLLLLSLLAACVPGNPANTPTAAATPGSTEPVPTGPAETSPVETESPDPGQTLTAPGGETATLEPVATETAAVTETSEATATGEATGTQTAPATEFPDAANYDWVEFVSGFVRPVDLQTAGDGSGRLFVVEQPGRIRIVQDGQLLPDPFLDIVPKVNSNGNEQGLLGMAFHPDYPNTNTFFVNYTRLDGDSVVARYRVSGDNPNAADPASEEVLFTVDQPYPNHNGGGVVFGPDGYLYLSFGDGGSAGDPQGNAQSLNTMLGKLLRIDVNTETGYQVPGDNPFASGGGLGEIWAYGLRNPWRFSFDRQTGDLYIGDVGQNAYEEIDYAPTGTPGLNYGWDYFEGLHPYEGTPPGGQAFVDPIFEYPHAEGCSITGGYVYRGPALPDWNGIYIFGDFCTGFIWGTLRNGAGEWQTQQMFQSGRSISAFGEDESGEIYLLDLQGSIYRLQSR